MIRRACYGFATAFACATMAAGQTTLSPDEALRALEAGNQRFVSGNLTAPALGEGVRRTLTSGQSPFAIIVTCTDSRVPPEHVFNAGLGELFVIRVAGNVCDPETLASIEHAAAELGAPLCVVMTHDHCDVVQAAAEATRVSPVMSRLLERIDPAVDRARREGSTGADMLARAEVENVHRTIAECQRRSTVLRELVRLRRLKFAAARYHMESGHVSWLPTRVIEHTSKRRGEPLRAVQGMPPHLAMSMLQSGHRRFLMGSGSDADLGPGRRESVARGPRPLAVVLTCSDSRVSPEHVFDCGIGELTVVRVHGNVLNDEALASIELAVRNTGASLLLVMGHDGCDAISSALDYLDDPRVSASQRLLLQRLEPAIAHAGSEGMSGEELLERATELNVLRTVAQARARSALVRALEREGALGVVPVLYDLASGDLHWLAEPYGQVATEEYFAAAPMVETALDVEFETPSPVVGGRAAGAPNAGHPAPAQTAPGMSRHVLDLLIAFMVATGGVTVLLMLTRRREQPDETTGETFEEFDDSGFEPATVLAEGDLSLFDKMDDFEDFAEIDDDEDEDDNAR